MAKVGIILVLVILSFFINLLYYTCWMLTDAWLIADHVGTEGVVKPN